MATPLLQFRFSHINNNQVTDHGSGINGHVSEGCTIVTDPVMGQCIHFDGVNGFITLGDLNIDFANGMSLTAWVNYEKFNDFSRIIEFGNGTAENNIVLYNQASTNELSFKNSIKTSSANLTKTNILNINEWMHLAITVDTKGVATLYIDGIQIVTQTNQSFIPENVVRKSNFIGKNNWADNGLFQGRMAWLSLYNEALSSDDILQEMNNSLVERGAFRASFPIDFNLDSKHHDSVAPVIFLESGDTPETLYLTIHNRSNSTLLLTPPKAPSASNDNYHFQLRFRPSVLSPNFIKKGKLVLQATDSSSTSAWQFDHGLDVNGNAFISLLATGKNAPQIKAFGSYQLVLKGIQADPSGGARTTNVEFFYKQVSFSATGAPLLGSRLQHLDIISHVGQKNIPLHVDVVGSRSVLNDGKSPNEILVRITNTSANDISLTYGNPASTFSIGMSGQAPDTLVEWALAEMDNLQTIQLEWSVLAVTDTCSGSNIIPLRKPLIKALPKGTSISISPPAKGQRSAIATLKMDCDEGATSLEVTAVETIAAGSVITEAVNGQSPWLAPVSTAGPASLNWSIVNSNQTKLKAGDSLVFLLSNIVTGLKSGATTLTVGYCNIPGFWDGQFTVNLIKSPLVSNENRIGIATNHPTAILDVNGDVDITGHINLSDSKPNALGPTITLENPAGGNETSSGLLFKTYNTQGQAATSSIVAADDNNYSNNLFFQTKTPGSNQNPLVTRATINASGLTVNGTIKGTGMPPPRSIMMQSGSITNDYDNSGLGIKNTPYEGWAICNGQNGTPNLQDRFIVGAGQNAGPNTAGGPDVHNHNIDAPSQNFVTAPAGAHSHHLPSGWYNRGLSCGCHTGIDVRSQPSSQWQTQSNGEHSHNINVNLSPFSSGPSGGLNRPKYYALYFIMRTQ